MNIHIPEYSKKPKMKSQMVYDYMKGELKKGRWKFGDKISTSQISKQFNISTRPVMDAIKMLENDRFVEVIPQSGCKVVDYSKRGIYEHFLISSALEGLSAELAAVYRSEDQINELDKFNTDAKKALASIENKIEYFDYNRQFHYRLLLMTGSKQMMSYAMPLWDLNGFYVSNLYEQFNIFITDSIGHHDEIILAVKEKDRVKAKSIMEKHIRSYVDRLNDSLPPSEDEQ